MLIASIVGLDIRSTMDLDTTLRGLPLTEEKVLEAVGNIIRIDLEDEVTFETVSINTIRKDDNYGGFCVRINAIFDTMLIPLSIDVSTGDIITPGAILYEFGGIFDENALFCYLADNGIVDLEGLTFIDIRDYIGLTDREMEVFTFHHKLTYLDELQNEFQKQFDRGKRLGVAFITETGKPDEDVISMLTAWDVIGWNNEISS